LVALEALSRLRIIHCDLKPENILLEDGSTPALKIIDFGSACYENQTVYTYIQSRFYRAPEVILGLPYSGSIDVWSLGCLCFELFAGLPLFPGQNQHRMLMRIGKCIGMPPTYMLDFAEHGTKYYNKNINGQWSFKTDEQFATEQRLSSIPQYRQYFKHDSFESIISHSSYRSGSNLQEREFEERERKSFIHLLKCMLRWDPDFRWHPTQLLKHPFITGEPLTEYFLAHSTDEKLGFSVQIGTRSRNRSASRGWALSHSATRTDRSNSKGLKVTTAQNHHLQKPNLNLKPNTPKEGENQKLDTL